MRYLSVCSGIEAATVAWHPLGWSAAAYSEIEAFPRAVLTHHYPDTPLHGDFTTIGADKYGPIDLLVGGTPCQSFSVAGLRGGLADDRGNLALQFLKLADRTRPRWIVWENVPGVLSSTSHDAPDPCPPSIDLDGDNGPADGTEIVVTDEYDADESHAFSCFLAGLSELGYRYSYRTFDAQYFGLAQRRSRVFVVGYFGDWRPPAAVFLERKSLSWHPAPRREKGQGVAGSLTSRASGGGGGPGAGTDEACAGYLQPVNDWPAEIAGTLDTYYGDKMGLEDQHVFNQRGSKFVPIALNENQQGEVWASETFQALNKGGGKPGQGYPCVAYSLQGGGRTSQNSQGSGWKQETCFTLNCMDEHAVAFTASEQANSYAWERDVYPTLNAQIPNDTSNIQQGVRLGSAVRRLTPRECERLQGFPDDYTLIPYRGKPAADGPRYKALGNSMAVPVMRWIGERIAMVEALNQQREAA